MEPRKTVEELERLAGTLAEARDAASDVANRALRENQVLKQELTPLMHRLLGMRPAEPELAQQTQIKRDRDRLLTLVTCLRDVLNGTCTPSQFVTQWQPSGALEQTVVSGFFNLLTNAEHSRGYFDLISRVSHDPGCRRLHPDRIDEIAVVIGVPPPGLRRLSAAKRPPRGNAPQKKAKRRRR